jgi:N-acetylglucosaminyl-diphospho-decaprenol L-rhamnosyltransferase
VPDAGGLSPGMGWSAVVVNYNAGAALLDCVASLEGAGGLVDVVVVDNDSVDGSAESLARAHPGARLVRAGANLGYARAANLGIAATGAPVVAVLNPDTVLRSGAAGAVLARFAAEPDLAAIGPRLLNPDGTVYPSARSIPSVLDAVGHGLLLFVWPANPFTRRYRQTAADPGQARDVDWVSGAAVWLRRSALDEVGGWDERFFMYVEDVELCARLRAARWRVAYEPGSAVEHRLGVSTAGAPYRMIAAHHRSLLRFAARRFTGPKRLLLPPAAGFLGVRALLAMAHHRAATITARNR